MSKVLQNAPTVRDFFQRCICLYMYVYIFDYFSIYWSDTSLALSECTLSDTNDD